MGGKELLQGKLEADGELWPGTLRGKTCKYSSGRGVLAHPARLRPHPGLPLSLAAKKGTPDFMSTTSPPQPVPLHRNLWFPRWILIS